MYKKHFLGKIRRMEVGNGIKSFLKNNWEGRAMGNATFSVASGLKDILLSGEDDIKLSLN